MTPPMAGKNKVACPSIEVISVSHLLCIGYRASPVPISIAHFWLVVRFWIICFILPPPFIAVNC